MATIKTTKGTVVADPPIARFLFSDTRMALVWLLVRVYVGWAWLEAGLPSLGRFLHRPDLYVGQFGRAR